MTTPLDWLIVGGGVLGTNLSPVLVNRAGTAPDRAHVLDPQEQPLETVWRVTGATGMRYLRSPGVHPVDLHPYPLRRFAKGAGKAPRALHLSLRARDWSSSARTTWRSSSSGAPPEASLARAAGERLLRRR